MNTIVLIALTLFVTQMALADENCQFEFGMPTTYSITAKDGGLASADSKKFSVTYRENNEEKTLEDAKIKIIKVQKFHAQKKSGHNGMGQSWTNNVVDYAVRLQVKTKTTELYPRMMGNQAVTDMTFSTICTSITKAN